MIAGLGESRWTSPWARGALGGPDAFIEHLKYFGYVLPSLTVLIAYREGWIRPKAILSALMSIIMIAFLVQEGGRRSVGVLVGAALITWLLLQHRFRPRVVVGALAVIVILLAGMEVIRQHRAAGFSAALPSELSDQQDSYLHVDDNFLRLSQIVQFFPDVHPYADFQPVFYTLTKPIPRVFWPDKPSDPGYDLAIMLGFKGLALTNSIVGELYAMNGLLVVFIGGLLFGRIANMWNKILYVSGGIGKPMIYGLGVMALFAALRSMQDLVIMSYGLIGWFVIASLLAHFNLGRTAARQV